MPLGQGILVKAGTSRAARPSSSHAGRGKDRRIRAHVVDFLEKAVSVWEDGELKLLQRQAMVTPIDKAASLPESVSRSKLVACKFGAHHKLCKVLLGVLSTKKARQESSTEEISWEFLQSVARYFHTGPPIGQPPCKLSID